MQEWDHTNFLVDLSGFYANCEALDRPGGVIQVDRRTPAGESVVAVVGSIEGAETDVESTNGYIEELIKRWMASNDYDAHVCHQPGVLTMPNKEKGKEQFPPFKV